MYNPEYSTLSNKQTRNQLEFFSSNRIYDKKLRDYLNSTDKTNSMYISIEDRRLNVAVFARQNSIGR